MEKIEDIVSKIEDREKEITKNLILKYLRKWPWFVLFCVLGVLIGFFWFKNSPNTYQVSSRLLIKNEESSLNNVMAFDNQTIAMGKNTNIEKHIAILKSYTLFRKALENLNWDYSIYQKKLLYWSDLYGNEPFKLIIPPDGINAKNIFIEIEILNDYEYNMSYEGQAYTNGNNQLVKVNKKVKFGEAFINEIFNFTLNKGNGVKGEKYFLNFNNLNSLTSMYLRKTIIYSEEDNSDLIIIMIEGNSIQRETDFINELNKVFIQFGMENRYEVSEKSMEFIDSQLARIKDNLGISEENFSDYRKNNQVMNLGQEAQAVSSQLEEFEQVKYLTQLQIDFYKNLLQYLDDANKVEEMVNPSVVGITDANLTGMIDKLNDLYRRREVLSYSVQDKNPALVILDGEIRIARDGLEETVKNQLKATESKIESEQERYNLIQSRLRKLPETEKKLIGIQREFDLNNELYTYMLQKKQEASISKASITPEIQVIDEAMVEAAIRTGPYLMKFVGVGLAGGLMLPFVFITLLSFFNTKIQNREEIENRTNISVLDGIILHKYKVNLPVLHHPRSGIAESFRGLKSNINAMIDLPGSKVISINSLIPGEGKSFVSSNLSVTLAKSNKKVLLIGADLHNPTLHNFLASKESLGLSSYLVNEKSFDEIISSTAIPNLYFIQAGTVPENPSDLLDTLKFDQLIDKAREVFDYIVIDNAPLLLVPDAILTCGFSDLSLFILRINFSNKGQIKQINKVVDFNGIKHAAIVLNESLYRGHGYGRKYWKKGYGEYIKT